MDDNLHADATVDALPCRRVVLVDDHNVYGPAARASQPRQQKEDRATDRFAGSSSSNPCPLIRSSAHPLDLSSASPPLNLLANPQFQEEFKDWCDHLAANKVFDDFGGAIPGAAADLGVVVAKDTRIATPYLPRRIRVGFASADFKDKATLYLGEPGARVRVAITSAIGLLRRG